MSSIGFAYQLAVPLVLGPVLLQGTMIAASLLPPPALSSRTTFFRFYSLKISSKSGQTAAIPKTRSRSKFKKPANAARSAKVKKVASSVRDTGAAKSATNTKPKKIAKRSNLGKPVASRESPQTKERSKRSKPGRPTPLESFFPPKTQTTKTPTATHATFNRVAGQPPRILSFLPTPPMIEPARADLVTTPPIADLNRALSLFRFPRFLYSAPRFLSLPFNTRTPEICLLGRSNVGKSTLINALAGLGGKAAGSTHGPSHIRKGLAITSAIAGCTKMMNAYGFGPPLSVPPLSRKAQDARKESARTRSQRRKKPRGRGVPQPEKMPAHSIVVMDMPGYGLNSREDWGTEILKYIKHRQMLAGAVLLIDAVAGVKQGDRMVLDILREAGLKTRVVLTKADKLVPVPDPTAWNSSNALRQVCLHVWDELRMAEKGGQQMDWHQGQGWTPEIFVTGAGDPSMGGMGVDGARLAICRLAGCIAEPVRQADGLLPDVVPHDQLVFASPSESTPVAVPVQQPVELESKALVGRGRRRQSTRASKSFAVEEDPVALQMKAAIRQPKSGRGKLSQASF